MIDLLSVEKQFLLPHVVKGGTVVDFTMGNGHDTLWLAQNVGADGHVYAFDIQKQAYDNTKKLLDDNGIENYTLVLDSHANAAEYVKTEICAGMFNLGYLPGGDKSITTLRESTLKAVEVAVNMLMSGGGLLIAVYPGHPEGKIEGELITQKLSELSRFEYCVSRFEIINSSSSPFFFLVEKK